MCGFTWAASMRVSIAWLNCGGGDFKAAMYGKFIRINETVDLISSGLFTVVIS